MSTMIISMSLAALLMSLISAAIWFLENKTSFGSWNIWVRRIIIGVIFGVAAILSTHFGVKYDKMVLNVRDVAPLSAGLFFNPWSGIIAGVIGAGERFIAGTYFGVGSYSTFACTLSTALAGVLAAVCCKFLFEGRRPSPFYAFAMGAIMEVFHMLVLLLSHLDDITIAFSIVQICSVPMILFTAIGLAASSIILFLLSGNKRGKIIGADKADIPISRRFQVWVIIVVSSMMVFTFAFSYIAQTRLTLESTTSLFKTEEQDLKNEIIRLTDNNINNDDITDISQVAQERHIAGKGFVFIGDRRGNIVSENSKFHAKTFSSLGIDSANKTGKFFFEKIDGEKYYCYVSEIEGYTSLMLMSYEDLYQNRDIFGYETALMEILVLAIIVGLIYVLVRYVIVENLNKVNESLSKITGGNLNEKVDVRDSVEFVSLSEDINSTVATLKEYIAEAENRINAELELARTIQHSALPGIFPPFPDKEEFDVYATMDSAKEVGGDFYDFFLIDDEHIGLVMADVSGKGIPAAMFMMKSKAIIKSLAESGLSPKEVFETGNIKICEGNDAEMFVTAWLGILNIKTGKMNCANAGHEYPVICRKNGSYEILRDKHGFVLGGMDDMKYNEYTIEMEPGDKLFLYTDGVTEATNAKEELFGTDRMVDALNGLKKSSPEKTLKGVMKAIEDFVDEAPQFDDITMMSFQMKDMIKPIVFTVKPDGDAAGRAVELVEGYFADHDVPMRTIVKLNIAVDEIVANIADYSGAQNMTLSCLATDNQAGICFKDDGIPYNPLAKDDPDITQDAEKREIGGLGIFMVKKTMDSIKYENIDGYNILTVKKDY